MTEDSHIVLFALAPSEELGKRVAVVLGRPLSPHEERRFEDGEHKTRPLISVRGKDVFVVSSLHGDQSESPNDRLCRLLFFLGTLRDCGAARVTAVVPYLAYARKDRRTKPRDPVTTRYVACLFEAVGTDRVVTLEVHNLQAFQNAFRIETVHLETADLLADHFAAILGNAPVSVVSPDAGGMKRAERFATALSRALGREVSLAIVEKYRSGGVVSGGALVGDVSGRTAIILDDLISTGTTIVRAARRCREHGAARVLAAATHGLFVDPGALLDCEDVDQVAVTDSVTPRQHPAEGRGKLAVLGIAELLGHAIDRLHRSEAIDDLA